MVGIDHAVEAAAVELGSAINPLIIKRRKTLGPRTYNDWRFVSHCLNNDLTNLAIRRHRSFQGVIATAKNSGTHWVIYSLSLALAAQYGVPPPRYSDNPSSEDVIGHPKHKRLYDHVPRIASTHSIPHVALDWRWLRRAVSVPRYVVVVRDMRDALISNYVKWRGQYQVPFHTYIAGDPTGKRYVADVWWFVHFLNRWGAVGERYPGEVMFMRYEDLRRVPGPGLLAIARHLRMDLDASSIEAAVRGSSKEAMLERRDPSNELTVIRQTPGQADPSFTSQEISIFRRIIAANMQYDYGYDYWAPP